MGRGQRFSPASPSLPLALGLGDGLPSHQKPSFVTLSEHFKTGVCTAMLCSVPSFCQGMLGGVGSGMVPRHTASMQKKFVERMKAPTCTQVITLILSNAVQTHVGEE